MLYSMSRFCLQVVAQSGRRYKTTAPATKWETVQLAYNSYESTESDAAATARAGPPLVVLHGLLGSKSNWNSMSKALHRNTGRRVISVDARNHGDSPHSPQHTYELMARDLLELLNSLGLSRVSLLGHSMGGRTAMTLALISPELVSSLVVVDISPVRTSASIMSMVSLFDAMKSVRILPGVPMSKARKLADEQLKAVAKDVNLRNFLITNLVQNRNGELVWRVNLKALRDNFHTEISTFPTSLKGLQYSGPTLFIGGRLSDYMNKNDLAGIKEYFPLAEMEFIAGAGHWVHSQKPEKFLEIATKFLLEK